MKHRSNVFTAGGRIFKFQLQSEIVVFSCLLGGTIVEVEYCDVPGSPCLSKAGPVYGPFFFLKFLGSISKLALSLPGALGGLLETPTRQHVTRHMNHVSIVTWFHISYKQYIQNHENMEPCIHDTCRIYDCM